MGWNNEKRGLKSRDTVPLNWKERQLEPVSLDLTDQKFSWKLGVLHQTPKPSTSTELRGNLSKS